MRTTAWLCRENCLARAFSERMTHTVPPTSEQIRTISRYCSVCSREQAITGSKTVVMRKVLYPVGNKQCTDRCAPECEEKALCLRATGSKPGDEDRNLESWLSKPGAQTLSPYGLSLLSSRRCPHLVSSSADPPEGRFETWRAAALPRTRALNVSQWCADEPSITAAT